MHPVSGSCKGERCHVRLASLGPLRSVEFGDPMVEVLCGADATHKLAEVQFDDMADYRHPLTAYVCCEHFRSVVGGSCDD